MKIGYIIALTALFLVITSPSGAMDNKATFAGGCYWCMEEAMERVDGIHSVTSGFTSGVEAVEVSYDPSTISYEKLLGAFWKNIDPTDPDGQFCDRGLRYRSAIFYRDEGQKRAAEKSMAETAKMLNKNIATVLLPATEFRAVAEDEQDFYKKKPFEYKQYKIRCGRDRRLKAIWKK